MLLPINKKNDSCQKAMISAVNDVADECGLRRSFSYACTGSSYMDTLLQLALIRYCVILYLVLLCYIVIISIVTFHLVLLR